MGFQATPLASVTAPQGDQQGWWLRRCAPPGQLRFYRVNPPAGPRPGRLRRSTGRQLFILPPVPQRAGPSIRERSRIRYPRTKSQRMHVHASDNIPVADKATAPTGPVPPCRLLSPVASWTAAAGSPLTAAEARDADQCTLLLQIVFVFAVFPLRHALVVMAPFVLVAHPMRIAHIQGLHALGSAEVHHLACALVPQVAHPALLLATLALFRVLQAAPAFGAFGAAGLQARELAQRPVVSLLDASHATPGDDKSLARGCGDRRLMDFAQVGSRPNGRGGSSLGSGRGWGKDHNVQLITPAPDQRDRSYLFRQIGQMEGKGLAPPSHRQDQALALARDRLGRPLHRPVLLGMVGVAMARVRLTQLLDGLDIGEKLLADHLDRLTVQRVLPALGLPLQVVAVRPAGLLASRRSVALDAVHPDLCGFQLRRFESRTGPPV
jgi:hypothetical protein